MAANNVTEDIKIALSTQVEEFINRCLNQVIEQMLQGKDESSVKAPIRKAIQQVSKDIIQKAIASMQSVEEIEKQVQSILKQVQEKLLETLETEEIEQGLKNNIKPVAKELCSLLAKEAKQIVEKREFQLSAELAPKIPNEADFLSADTLQDDYTLVLSDIDGVLIFDNEINLYLIQAMKLLQQDPKVHIAALSNMGFGDFVKETKNGKSQSWCVNTDERYRRTDLLKDAEEKGFQLRYALTNGDLGYGHGPGAVFSKQYLVLAAEYEKVKNLSDEDRRKIGFLTTASDWQENLEKNISLTYLKKKISAFPYTDLLIPPGKPGSYFDSDNGHLHGVSKIAALCYFLHSSVKKPRKMIFIDDNYGCIQAVRATIDVYNQQHPGQTITLETYWYRGAEFHTEQNMVAEHFAEKAKTFMPASTSNALAIPRLRRALNEITFFSGQKIKNTIFNELIALAGKGSPEALFMLAQVLCRGTLGQKNHWAAYRFACCAIMFSENKTFKEEVRTFIEQEKLSEKDLVQQDDTLQNLLDSLEPMVLNQGALLWKQLKAYRRKQAENVTVKKAEHVLQYRSIFNLPERLYLNEAKLAAYYAIMNVYLSSEDTLQWPVYEECIETYFRPLLVNEYLWTPEDYFLKEDQNAENLDNLVQKETTKLQKKLNRSIAKSDLEKRISQQIMEMKEDRKIFCQNIEPIKCSFEKNCEKERWTTQGPFKQASVMTDAEQLLQSALYKEVSIIVDGKKQVNPAILTLCAEGNAPALFLLAQAALKGDGVVRDPISAYYLMQLACWRTTDTNSRKEIQLFIERHFSPAFVESLRNSTCDKAFPRINGCTPNEIFEWYKCYKKEEYASFIDNKEKILRVLNANKKKLGSSELDPLNVVDYSRCLFSLAKELVKKEALFLAYCFAMRAYLNCSDEQYDRTILTFIEKYFIDVCWFFLREPEKFFVLEPEYDSLLNSLKTAFTHFDFMKESVITPSLFSQLEQQKLARDLIWVCTQAYFSKNLLKKTTEADQKNILIFSKSATKLKEAVLQLEYLLEKQPTYENVYKIGERIKEIQSIVSTQKTDFQKKTLTPFFREDVHEQRLASCNAILGNVEILTLLLDAVEPLPNNYCLSKNVKL